MHLPQLGRQRPGFARAHQIADGLLHVLGVGTNLLAFAGGVGALVELGTGLLDAEGEAGEKVSDNQLAVLAGLGQFDPQAEQCLADAQDRVDDGVHPEHADSRNLRKSNTGISQVLRRQHGLDCNVEKPLNDARTTSAQSSQSPGKTHNNACGPPIRRPHAPNNEVLYATHQEAVLRN
jgi:hypothetical protein